MASPNFRLANALVKSSTNKNLPAVPLNRGANGECRDPDTGTCGVISLRLNESIYSQTVMGEAILRDYDGSFVSALGAQIGLGGYDILEMQFIQDGGEGVDNANKTLFFMIYAYSQISDEVESISKQDGSPRIISLKLASPEFALLNYLFFEYFETDEDMILPISKIVEEGEDETPPPGTCTAYNEEGLVQYLISRMNTISGYNIQLNSENTKNWVWLKRNYMMYPWGKMVSPPRIMQLMQMLADNGVHESNENAVNFLFWRGLDSWNFHSLETLVERGPTKRYKLSTNLNCMESVGTLLGAGSDEVMVKSYDETDYLDLMKSFAFGANYLSVNPNYADPYTRYLDAAGGHIIKQIEYDYFTQGGLWNKLPNDQYSDYIGAVVGCNDGLIKSNSKNNRIVDNNYGYFSPGFFNNEKQVPWEYFGYTYSSRQEKTLWQTQFDITPIPGEELYNVMKKVKLPLQKARERYAQLKNLKERWKVYKCSVCCAGDIDSNLAMGVTGVSYSGDITLDPGFTDPKFAQSFNLRNTVGQALSDYEIVAAGSFTDVINYDISKVGVGPTGCSLTTDENGDEICAVDGNGNPVIIEFENEWTRSGMTLSYNLNESPYNLSLGEFFSLEKKPDNFVRYRFDLEIKRHEKLRDILNKNIEARKIRIAGYTGAVLGYTAAYDARVDVCNQAGCTGYCVCPTEYPETVVKRAELITKAHEALAEHERVISEYIQPNIDKLKKLKEEFISLYDKYWSRKAFFFSKNIDFSFLKSNNNLFNIKSITRKSIVGSRYQPFAVRKSLNGVTFQNGQSGYYPYQVPPFWGDLGEANACTSIANAGFANNIKGITVDVYYGRKYDNYAQEFQSKEGETYKVTPAAADFWSSFEAPFSNFPYSENNDEKAKGPIWYRNWLVNYEITLIKPPCLNRRPPCVTEEDCACDEIILPLSMHFETFANGQTADILNGSTLVNEYAYTQLQKNCDGCKIRITNTVASSDIKLYHPWAADELKNQIGNPIGFTAGTYVQYKKAASLFRNTPGVTGFYDNEDNELYDQFDKWTPPHLLLEGLESYVRVEFQTPIGLESLANFPEGFVDTYGSEYFTPYIVLATAGPFGSQSARANISVIGQDPYGFDLAVKKIKNREDFAGMNLVYSEDISGDIGDPNQEYPDFTGQNTKYSHPDLRFAFGTSSSWMKNSQNSLFYKPKDGIADLFVPQGIQDIFRASALEKSIPAKTWWDLWVSLPPIAVSTFYNRSDVLGSSGGSMTPFSTDFSKWFRTTSDYESTTGMGIAFYSKDSLVAHPFVFTGAIGPCGCSGGCNEDKPWPLFLQPDTEQIVSGAFPYNVAIQTPSDLLESFGNLGNFFYTSDPGATLQGASRVLSSDPSNYIYNFAEFPHIVGLPASGDSEPIMGIRRGLNYPVISYPVGTLIWGKNIPSKFVLEDCTGVSGEVHDYNMVHQYDISRKTEYGLVQLSSDSMPSIITMIGGVGGNIQKAEQYNRWVSDRLIDWFQNTIFDNNFSGQFVVLGKGGGENSCKGYPCMNPDGFPGLQLCPPDDPLCNCPCIDVRPDLLAQGVTLVSGLSGSLGKEPSKLELEYLEKVISECDLVKAEPCLGQDWLGCVWDDPYSTMNCNCPCIGKKFPTYVAINRTNATFWGTPLTAPLLRTAQMALFNANKIEVDVYGDITVKAGDVILLDAANETPGGYSRFHGYWLISTIAHDFAPFSHKMKLSLSRELPYPCGGQPTTPGSPVSSSIPGTVPP